HDSLWSGAAPRLSRRLRPRGRLARRGRLLRARRALLRRLRDGLGLRALLRRLVGRLGLMSGFVHGLDRQDLAAVRFDHVGVRPDSRVFVGLDVLAGHRLFLRRERFRAYGRRRARIGGRDVAAPLAQRLVQDDGARGGRVQRRDLPFHRDPHHLIATLEHEAADALALAADDDRGRAAIVDLVVEELAGLVGADDPDALLLERVDRLPEVRDLGDHQVLARAGARLRDRGRESDRAVLRDDDAVDAGAFAGAKEHAEVLGILERVDGEHERGLVERVEMEQELLELDARLALGDRHDALVALDRREALDLQGIDEAHEDATLLRFGQQLVHRTGARAALVRHEQ